MADAVASEASTVDSGTPAGLNSLFWRRDPNAKPASAEESWWTSARRRLEDLERAPRSEIVRVHLETTEQKLAMRDFLGEVASEEVVHELFRHFDVEAAPEPYAVPPSSKLNDDWRTAENPRKEGYEHFATSSGPWTPEEAPGKRVYPNPPFPNGPAAARGSPSPMVPRRHFARPNFDRDAVPVNKSGGDGDELPTPE
jgi:hypothetical protein